MKRKLSILFFSLLIIVAKAQMPNFDWVDQAGSINTVMADAIISDKQGNTYTAGRFTHTTDFDPGPGTYTLSVPYPNYYNIFILKLDAAGNFIWAKGFTGNASGQVNSIAIDTLNNVYTTGSFTGRLDFDPGVGTFTFSIQGSFISKLDALGNFVWAKNFGYDPYLFTSNSISLDTFGNVYTTGLFQDSTDFDPGPGTFTMAPASADAYVLKLNTAGNFVWAKHFESQVVSSGFSLKIGSGNNIFVAGSFNGETDFDPDNVNTYTLNSVGSRDVFITKLDASGNFVWVKTFGGGYTEPSNIVIDATNNIYTSGYFNNTADFDPGPAVYTLSTTARDFFVSKLDTIGNFIWAISFGNAIYNQTVCPIAADISGNVYATGTFSNTVDFDPGVGTYTLASAGQEDVFILRLDAAGNFGGAKRLGGAGSDIARGITLDNNGNLFTTGYFTGTSDFDPGPGVYNLTSITTDMFVFKMDQNTVGIKENSNVISAGIYPNPTNSILNIELDSESFEKLTGTKTIEILNTLGQVVLSDNMNANHLQLNAKSLNSGLYILKIINDNKIIAAQKIIKE